MCVICYKPKGAKLPSRDTLETCFINNPHGAGYAIWRDGKKHLYYKKGFFDFDSLYTALLSEKINDKDIVGVHFRIATHGALEPKNCHPFFVSAEKESPFSVQGSCKSVLFHNGILNKKYSYKKDVSDTYLFTLALGTREKDLIARGEDALKNFIAKETEGSRILYFHASEKTIIMSGNWEFDKDTGCYFSNNSYLPYTWRSTSFYEPITSKDQTFLACPDCGELHNFKCISRLHDLYLCGECGALFDSFGYPLELVDRQDNPYQSKY